MRGLLRHQVFAHDRDNDTLVMEAMRVTQVIATLDPSHGGPSSGSVELNRALRRLGVDATILTLTRGDVAGISETGASIKSYRSGRSRFFQFSTSFLRDLFQSARQSDIVHIHGTYLVPNALAYAISRITRTPYGVQLHGVLEPYQRTTSARAKRLFDLVVGNRVLRHAAYVMCTSESEASNAADRVDRRKIIVSPLGASIPDSLEDEALAEQLGSAPRTRTVLFMGRLATKKRPDLAIRGWAAAGITDGFLVIAGPEGEWTIAELSDIADECGVGSTVKFVGMTGGGAKGWLLRRCGVFVLPSENENFGISVVEAMLGGSAIIVSDAVGAAEHVRQSGGGVVLSDIDPVCIGSAIRSYADNPVAANQAGSMSRKYAGEKLSWDSTAGNLLRTWRYPSE